MNVEINDIEFSAVRKMIGSRMGLNFPEEGWGVLKYRLSSAAGEAGFEDLSGFIQWILSSELNQNQINLLAHHITISETYFWREPQVFAAIDQSVLRELIASRNEIDKSINVWCAGCSTGEEAYSLAIALIRAIPVIEDWKISILATDINPNALAKAGKGVYRSWSFRNSPYWLRDLYFTRKNSREYEIIPEIKEMVTFSNFNLTRHDFLSTICKNHKMDIIFCRNVLMYLTKDLVTNVAKNFYNSLQEGGWLVVSSCELSTDLFPQFSSINFPGAVLYRKPLEGFSDASEQLIHSSDQGSLNIIPVSDTEKEIIRPLSSDRGLRENVPEETASYIRQNISETDSLNQITRLKLREVIINESTSSISSLASQGRLEEALAICNEALESDKLARSLYTMKASILLEMDKNIEAIKSLKQAIFIDPDFLLGHFTLGNLFKQQGNIKNARRHFINALELLDKTPEDKKPVESDGISEENIRKIILDNLRINMAI
jgi:chemotaxis protein methyltransferase CheR